jgi:hypothetical protein
MSKREDLVHFRDDGVANGELSAEPPGEFADQNVAHDHAFIATFEMMLVPKTGERPVRQFLGELVRRIEDAAEELKDDWKDSIDGLNEPGDAGLYGVREQFEARHPFMQHRQVGGVFVKAKEVSQVGVDPALIDEFHRTPSRERRTSDVRSKNGFRVADERLAAATIRPDVAT